MIHVTCKNCGVKLKVSDAAAGRTKPCPKCGRPITVPDPIYEAEAVPEPDPVSIPPPDDLYGLQDSGPADEAPVPGGEARRPCPMCGEMIVASAAKCRFCGEIFDPTLKKAEIKKKKKKRRSTDPDDEDLTVGEWIIAILCNGIGCIVGVIWMIQGKPKGKKMFLVSIFTGIVIRVLAAVIQQALVNK